MKRLLFIALTTLWLQTALAQAAAPQSVIVDAAAVLDALARKALVWDVRPADAFAKGHIPGAVNIGDAAAVLRNANLTNTNLRGSTMGGADLTGAEVAGADFTQADVNSARLVDLHGLDKAVGMDKTDNLARAVRQ